MILFYKQIKIVIYGYKCHIHEKCTVCTTLALQSVCPYDDIKSCPLFTLIAQM